MSEKTESIIIESTIKMLTTDYGFSNKQIKREVPVQKKPILFADLVVYDSKTNAPLLVIEVKREFEFLPLAKNQLKKLMNAADAKYGILYNGVNKLCFELYENILLEIPDIPITSKEKSILPKPLTDPENTLWAVLEKFRKTTHPEFALEVILQILVCKLMDEIHFSPKLLSEMDFDDQQNYLKIQDLWSEAKYRFPMLTGEEVRVEPPLATLLVHTLRNFSLKDSNLYDVLLTLFRFFQPQKMEPPEPPKELIHIMLDMINFDYSKKTFFPFVGMGRSLMMIFEYVQNKNKHSTVVKKLAENLVCMENEKKLLNVTNLIFILLAKQTNVQIFSKLMDDIEQIHMCEQVILTRLISILPRTREIFDIDHFLPTVIRQVAHGSKIAVVVPSNFLYHRSSKTSEARAIISEFCKINAILKFPKGILSPYSAIPCCVLILERKFNKLTTSNNVFVVDLNLNSKKHPTMIDQSLFNMISNKYKEFTKLSYLPESSSTIFVKKSPNLRENNWDLLTRSPLQIELSEIQNPTRLGDLVEIRTGKSISIKQKQKEEEIEIPYIRILDLDNFMIKDQIEKTIAISEKKSQSLSSMTRVRPNDVLLSIQGTIGKIAIAKEKDFGAYVSPQLAILRIRNDNILPDYLLYIFTTNIVREQLDRLAQGMIMKRISRDLLKLILIPLPPVFEQEKIIANFSRQLYEIEQLQNKLNQAKESLKKFQGG